MFVEDSKKAGFVGLKGHRFVGGLRASLYNAIPIENVEALVRYMKEFEVAYIGGAYEISNLGSGISRENIS